MPTTPPRGRPHGRPLVILLAAIVSLVTKCRRWLALAFFGAAMRAMRRSAPPALTHALTRTGQRLAP